MLLRIVVTLLAGLCLPAFADFSYQETSKLTGGALVRMMKMIPGGGRMSEPQLGHVYLKGNKLARVDERGMNIVDIDAETITDVNIEKKQYSVITFAEMAQALEAMRKKLEREMAKQRGKDQPAPEIKFDVKVQETGQKKIIEGFDAKEMQMLMDMGTTDPKTGQTATMRFDSSMWVTPEVGGYEEVQQFYMRMAKKLDWAPQMNSLGAIMRSQPGMGEGLAKMAAEAQKIKGVQLVTVSAVVMLGQDGQPVETPEINMPSSGEIAEEASRSAAAGTAARAAGGRFGGLAGAAAGGMLGGFGRKKKKEEPKAEEPPPQQEKAAAPGKKGALMEITVETSGHSRGSVDSAKLAVPAGFKEVEHEMKKIIREEAGK